MNQKYYASDKKPNLVLKVCLLGEEGVGKRTFCKSICADTFYDNTKLTIGIDFYTYDYPFGPQQEQRFIRFSLWVYEPISQFRKMFRYYLNGSNVICIMFDCLDPSSLKNIDGWLELIKKKHAQDSYILLLGNKIDLVSHPEYVRKAAKLFVEKYQLDGYFEISALKTSNINKPFEVIANHYLRKFGLIDN